MQKLSSILLAELEKRGLSYKKAGKLLHEQHGMNVFNAINKTSRLREEFAVKLEKAFGISALFILMLNVKERLETVRKRKVSREEITKVLARLIEDDDK